MCEYYHIVPWYNSEEWHSVYDAIYSENCNKQDAVNMLLLWKVRCPSLPSGVESTLSLLQVHVQDRNMNDDIAHDQILRLAYSSAVMRFVNHMLDSEAAKGASLYTAAKNLGVPDWVIGLRHDTAHSNILPSLTLLRSACEISLDWLRNNYWEKHKEYIQDYTSGLKDATNNDRNRIDALIYFYSCLSICIYCEIEQISNIPDINMQDSIVTDARDLLGDLTDLSNLETESVRKLVDFMDIHAKKFLNGKDTIPFVNNALLGEESLFLSLDLVDLLSKKEFEKSQLSRRYVHCFEVLLTFLHKNDLLVEFVLALIKMTQNNDQNKKALLAALWVSEILASLKKSKQFLEKVTKFHPAASTTQKNLKQMYLHWFPSEKASGLILDLHKPAPTKITDINFIQHIISSFNPYLTYFVNDLLTLVQPKIPKEVCSKISKLAKLISTPHKFPVEFSPSKIYTIADVEAANEIEMCVVSETNYHQYSIDTNTITGIWKIATKRSWSSCPIGEMLDV